MLSRLVKRPPSAWFATRRGTASAFLAGKSRPTTQTCDCVAFAFSSATMRRPGSGGNGGSASLGILRGFHDANALSRSATMFDAVTSPETEITASFGAQYFWWKSASSSGVIEPTDSGVPPDGLPQGCPEPKRIL